jgi:hypothetical protein
VRRLRSLCEELSATVGRLERDAQANDHGTDSPLRRVETGDGDSDPSDSCNVASRDADWHDMLFDGSIADEPPLARDRRALVAGLLRGEGAARGLVGRLLTFRAAAAEELPPLLKEIGEAYYRWCRRMPDEPTALGEALIRMLEGACARAGLGHRIEQPRVGDRFDRERHQSSSGGWELTAVRGWVVLREKGGVYTKAAVDVR